MFAYTSSVLQRITQPRALQQKHPGCAMSRPWVGKRRTAALRPNADARTVQSRLSMSQRVRLRLCLAYLGSLFSSSERPHTKQTAGHSMELLMRRDPRIQTLSLRT